MKIKNARTTADLAAIAVVGVSANGTRGTGRVKSITTETLTMVLNIEIVKGDAIGLTESSARVNALSSRIRGRSSQASRSIRLTITADRGIGSRDQGCGRGAWWNAHPASSHGTMLFYL